MPVITNKLLFFLLTIFIVELLSGPALSFTTPRIIDDFKGGLKPDWEAKKFKGETSYKTVTDEGIPCLRAEARGSASGLFYKIEYEPEQNPILSWKWKVDNIVEKGDARSKAGDDYAARIYVVFPSMFFWRTKAINYIWANKLPVGEALNSSYTANDIMVAVDSGAANTGKWREYRRNVYEDYIRYFGSPPGKVGAIAIMTDTDNTGGTATACYGPIIIDKATDKKPAKP
ncbi:MAG: DUF3047 domain-containing protein [Thermodesulfobacteriota bacterium]